MEKIGLILLGAAKIPDKTDNEHEIAYRIVSDLFYNHLSTQNYIRWDNFYSTT